MRRLCTAWAIVSGCWPVCRAERASAQRTDLVPVRGHVQSVHLYGVTNARPVIVSSGDGGWIHLGPHVAQLLAAHGCFVVGFDVKAYLASFTSGKDTLRPEDEPGDYRVLVDFAARGSIRKPVLVGTSEGAGLSVLAAADPRRIGRGGTPGARPGRPSPPVPLADRATRAGGMGRTDACSPCWPIPWSSSSWR